MRPIQKLIILFVFSTALSFCKTYAQEDIPVRALPTEIFVTVQKPANDSIKWRWKRGGSATFNFGQNSQKNWSAGGDNFSMSISSYVNLFLYYQDSIKTWDNNLDWNFGYINATSTGGVKNTDLINFTTKYGYKIDSSGKLSATIFFNGRSQLFDGRQYFSKDSSKLISTFLSPGYAVTALGLNYQMTKYFSIFASPFTGRLTVVFKKNLAVQNLYGIGEHRYQIAPGFFCAFNFQKDIMKNVNYKATLDFFSQYNHNPQDVDMDMSNYFTFKINKILSATYALNLIYDDDVKLFGPHLNSPGLQVQSQIGIGIAMPFKNGYTRIDKKKTL